MINTYKYVRKVLWIILLANLGVAIAKITIGTVIHSASMVADGFHSLTDGSSNIIALIGIRLASKPVDEDHPYGHQKFETLAGLFIAGFLLLIGGRIIIEAISRFLNPVSINITVSSLAVIIGTLCVNIFVSIFEYKKGRKLDSQILISDSMHTRSDVFISIGVLLTLLCIKLGVPSIIDPIVSLIVSVCIIFTAYKIFINNRDVLVDKIAIETDKIKEITMSFEQVKGAHNIRSRGSKNDAHIDMHILTEPDMSVEQAHILNHNIEARIRNEISENIEVIAHLEPFRSKNLNV